VRPVLVVLVAMAFAFAGSIVASRFSPAEPPPSPTLHGTTEQGVSFRLTLDERRRVRTFAATALMHCSDGRVVRAGWYPSAGGAPARFGSRGPVFEATELRPEPSGAVSEGTLRGTILRDRARGTVEMSRAHGRVRCSSGLVSWTAR
jgi:hypothetical protein